jgi:UDP-N-acetyl-2-amino-2-deoxyglucuronate dehydrogenase
LDGLWRGDADVNWFRTQEYYDKGGWRGTWKLDGGGALMNQSIHAIDLLQWYMGPVETVCAFASTLGHERIEVEDTAAAALRFKSGALGMIEGTTAASPGLPRRIEISGTGGTAIQEEDVLKAWSFARPSEDDEQARQRFSPDTVATAGAASDPGAISFEGHRLQLEDMVAAMEEGREPAVTGREARKAVQIILAIYRSARESRMVSLPLT